MNIPSIKYIAAAVILVLLIVFWFYRRTVSKSPSKTKKVGAGTTKRGAKKKPGKKSGGKSAPRKNSAPPDSDDDEDEETSAVKDDAEELYNLVHDGLCNNMQQDEFAEVVGDLADNFVFIELKQRYNQAIQKKMDPSNTVTINDYIDILQKENNSGE